MKFKKVLLCTLCSVFLATSVNVKPASALRCELWDLLNALVTPLPTNDTNTDLSALLAQLEQILQTIEAIKELEKYIEKLEKLSEDASSLSDALTQVDVPEIESPTKGSQTNVDAYKGTAPDVQTPSVDFENGGDQLIDAVSEVAIVSNPVGNVEEQAAIERKDAYIQQATIDLLSDILVAKKKLKELKESDTDSLSSSSSNDTVGAIHVASQMKDFENQVQTLEHKIKALQNLLEGIRGLKAADPVKEKISVGG